MFGTLAKNPVPYQSITFLETVKLFKYLFCYSDNNPSFTLATLSNKKFLE